MDDLETLLFRNSLNLSGSDVVDLLNELASLYYLDVTGILSEWDSSIQSQLYAWDSLEGNILVIPEPATVSLLAVGGLALLRRRK